MKAGPNSIDEYIAAFPEATQKLLREMRATIRAAAPEAAEKISYQIPTFFLKGNLVHFGAFKNHIGFYPTSSGTQAFEPELSVYDVSKGTVRFQMGKPLPLDLVTRIVRFRVAENLSRAAAKSQKRESLCFPGD
jgi:uncharacterized protein YdhG (YjbR/CyaY superfamily)